MVEHAFASFFKPNVPHPFLDFYIIDDIFHSFDVEMFMLPKAPSKKRFLVSIVHEIYIDIHLSHGFKFFIVTFRVKEEMTRHLCNNERRLMVEFMRNVM